MKEVEEQYDIASVRNKEINVNAPRDGEKIKSNENIHLERRNNERK
jgi:hypothetical protein